MYLEKWDKHEKKIKDHFITSEYQKTGKMKEFGNVKKLEEFIGTIKS